MTSVVASSPAPSSTAAPLRRWLWLGWLLLLMLTCGFVSVAHGADAMWDLKNYHLYNPFAAFHDRYAVDVAPAQQQSYLNPLLDYPFYVAIRLFDGYPRTIAFGMGLPQGVNLWLVSLIAWRCLPGFPNLSRAGLTLLATLVGATGAGTLPLVGGSTGDLTVALPVLAALLLVLRGIDAAASRAPFRRSVFLAGLLAGAAVGAKPTMGCYALGLGAALLVALPWRLAAVALLHLAIGGTTGALATGGYHAARMAWLFDNPLFPFANTLFHSPFWEKAPLRDARFLPKTARDALLYPFEWAAGGGGVAELPFRDIRVALVFGTVVLVAMTALLARTASGEQREGVPRGTVALFAFAAVGYTAWLLLFSIYRYLLPVEMLSGALVLAGLVQLARAAAVPALMAAVAIACWVTTVPLEWGHTPFRDHYIEVYAPPLAPGTLVLIVGSDPVSFIVPFMDPGARWLSLTNNLLAPTQGNAMVGRERDIIAAHSGPIAVLDAGLGPDGVAATLASFGLAVASAPCGEITSNLGSEDYSLCPVLKVVQ